MPDAPAGSLRQAVTQAASGTWPAEPGTLLTATDPDSEPFDDEPDSSAAPAAAGHPRLKDLPGKVVRITHLREFHITDEDALLHAAARRGWEPLPASELGDDDPRDLAGAVITLTEDSDVTGSQTLEDQKLGRGAERRRRRRTGRLERSARRHPVRPRLAPAPAAQKARSR
ncbi:hypothetical protein [Streptomyces sp. NPDC048225]|uniref:hypothetical protein n=1 Tax=Streptomyces sp. NPDC048225 TaxID=3365518 RepID=UPI00371B3113